MRRIQIYIDEATDDALAAAAGRTGVSKAALIRRLVDDGFRHAAEPRGEDPLATFVGRYDEDPGDVDAVVYGG